VLDNAVNPDLMRFFIAHLMLSANHAFT
jgi:hypothetical protein